MAFTKITQYLASIKDLQKMRKESYLEYQKKIDRIGTLRSDGVYTQEYVSEMLEKEKKQYEVKDGETIEKIKTFMDSLWAEIFQPAEIDSSRFVNRLNVINSIGSELSRGDLVELVGSKEMVLHQRELALLKKACKKQGLDTKPFENFMFETENYDLSSNGNITHTAEEFLNEWKRALDSGNDLSFAYIFGKVCQVLQEDIQLAPEDSVFISHKQSAISTVF